MGNLKGGGLNAGKLSLAGGAMSGRLGLPSGSAGAPSLYWNASPTKGFYYEGNLDATVAQSTIGTTVLYLPSTGAITFLNGTLGAGGSEGSILRFAANTYGIQNADVAQAWRVYGAATGAKYLALLHDGTNAKIQSSSGDLTLVPSSGQTVPASDGASYLGAASLRFIGLYTSAWTIGATAALGLTSIGNSRFAHGVSALATTATEGFFHMQSCAGAPTGVPASIPTGQIPWVIDSTNKKLYAYIGAAWLKAQVGAVDLIFG